MTDEHFYGYPPSSKKGWIRQALKETGAGDYEELISNDEFEGLVIPPFFTAEDSEQNSMSALPNSSMFRPGLWENISYIDLDKDPPEVIGKVLAFGIDGVVMHWSGEGDLGVLLREVKPDFLTIWLKPKKHAVKVVQRFLQWADATVSEKSKLRGGVLWDVLVMSLSRKEAREEVAKEMSSLYALTKDYPEYRGVCIDFSCYQRPQFNITQEITYGLGVMIEVLDVLTNEGEEVEEALDNFFVFVAAGNDFFLHLAKIKVLRIMFRKLLLLYEVEDVSHALYVFASTSDDNHDDKDSENNMVRNTLEAMLVILGGSDALWVKGHSEDASAVFSRRTAANVSNLLRYESHFDKLGDAVDGSYYLEYLIETLLQKVEKTLVQLEEDGGWWKVFPHLNKGPKTNEQ
ncbi:hypothetical protein DN752_06570 [Echinicola strongylocentroti]|uniref:Methylmalonyl-CoA mutase alpha/beta chain catalytic domain-containing protein n=1 Tax=Echinicola strongylocentroti TaxID=1795355 RepID=A0A2Z4IGH2_9BACT|nr:methylmalonyl-CoA mutase family protein [Echinicola strongylocentroti]AWW29809.1 hypothetical protein DN752_06570 [Echinicola strongylocentroti]